METVTNSTNNEALRWFIYDYCGGPSKASFKLEVSATAIHNWISAGCVLSKEKAVEMANICGWRVTPAQLLGVPEAPPEVAPNPDEQRPPKGRAASAPPKVDKSDRLAEAAIPTAHLRQRTRGRRGGPAWNITSDRRCAA